MYLIIIYSSLIFIPFWNSTLIIKILNKIYNSLFDVYFLLRQNLNFTGAIIQRVIRSILLILFIRIYFIFKTKTFNAF